MSQTSLLALIDLYEHAASASATLSAAVCTAGERIACVREEQAARDKGIIDPDAYEVLLDSLGIIEFAIESRKLQEAIPMLTILHGRIRGVLSKTQAGGTVQ